MFVDSDIILSPNCISKLSIDLMKYRWAGACARVLSLENQTYWQRAEDVNVRLHLNETGVKSLIGIGEALFRKQVLLMHPFDPNFVVSEDVDICLRLSQAGEKLGVSDAVAYYRHRRELPELIRQRVKWGLDARLALKYKSIRIVI